MQNSGLGAALARQHFAALPCALSATFHSVIGSVLAGFWRMRPVPERRNLVNPPPALVVGG
jgi:BASS family bile acid:Na+ symporter